MRLIWSGLVGWLLLALALALLVLSGATANGLFLVSWLIAIAGAALVDHARREALR